MGLQKLFYRTHSKETVTEEEPHEIISQNMSESGRFFALYSKKGQYLVDHFGKLAEANYFNLDEAFYLVMNLNFVHSFYNCAQMGIYNFPGTELISPELASFKLVHHLKEGALIEAGSKSKGLGIDLHEYAHDVLLARIKKPKEWKKPAEGLLRVHLQVSLIFNPLEIESFLLKIPL